MKIKILETSKIQTPKFVYNSNINKNIFSLTIKDQNKYKILPVYITGIIISDGQPILTTNLIISLLNLYVGITASSTPVTGSGGVSPLAYSIAPSLPSGLTLNSVNGLISGIAGAIAGPTPYTVTVTDNVLQTSSKTFTLRIYEILTTTLVIPTVSLITTTPASTTPVTATGGVPPLIYSISPALPSGLTLTSSTGLISGTPGNTAGPISYTVTATDNQTQTSSKTFSLTIYQILSTTLQIPTKTLYKGISDTITPVTASGGAIPLVYSVTPSLPSGLTLSSSSGQISGAAGVTALSTFYNISVTDNISQTSSKGFTLTIDEPASLDFKGNFIWVGHVES